MLDFNGIIPLGKEFPSKKANRYIEWFTNNDETIFWTRKTDEMNKYKKNMGL